MLASRTTRPSRILSDSESHKKPLSICRLHHGSSFRNCCERLVLKGRYSISATRSNKSSERVSNSSRQSIDLARHRSFHSLEQSVIVIEPINAYDPTALDCRSYRFSTCPNPTMTKWQTKLPKWYDTTRGTVEIANAQRFGPYQYIKIPPHVSNGLRHKQDS